MPAYRKEERARDVGIGGVQARERAVPRRLVDRQNGLGMGPRLRHVAEEEEGVGQRTMRDQLLAAVAPLPGEPQHLVGDRERLARLGARDEEDPAAEQRGKHRVSSPISWHSSCARA